MKRGCCKHKQAGRRLYEDDGGFSTVGMVLALLITLSLIFSAAQVYRINSQTAQVQDVADAAALSAENTVAEYYIAAQACDAIILSLSLTGISAVGLGVVALCVPPVQPLGEQLIQTGTRIIDARDSFASKAAEGLNAVQRLLPFLAAASAASVTQANNADRNTAYFGFAVLLPLEGKEIVVGAADAAKKLAGDAQDNTQAIEQAAAEAERAAQQANKYKQEAFMADCGAAPAYCMYERAETLALLIPAQNPLYTSVDAWSFSVALNRSKAYYPKRLQIEQPLDASVEERAKSALRKRFYTYACTKMDEAYVHEDNTGSFDAYFPLLPRNTDQMRQTNLFTEVVYPATEAGNGMLHAHAYADCPQAAQESYAGETSAAAAEGEGYEECPLCLFSATSIGKVAAASTSIENGFEYHYTIVAQAAENYTRERRAYEPQAKVVKDGAGNLLGQCKDALAQAAGNRIEAFPPGRSGAIALVADTSGVPVDDSLITSFVNADATVGTRAAISGAGLVDDEATQTQSVLTQILSSYQDVMPAVGIPAQIVDIWSAVLFSYGQGQEQLTQGVADALDSIPLVSASGLGSWASQAMNDAIESVGLQPAELSAPKPVTVNTAHIAGNGQCSFADVILSTKREYISLPGSGTGSPLSAAVSALRESALTGVDSLGQSVLVVEVAPLGEDGPSFPLEITLPPQIVEYTGGAVSALFDRIGGVVASVGGGRVWE